MNKGICCPSALKRQRAELRSDSTQPLSGSTSEVFANLRRSVKGLSFAMVSALSGTNPIFAAVRKQMIASEELMSRFKSLIGESPEALTWIEAKVKESHSSVEPNLTRGEAAGMLCDIAARGDKMPWEADDV